MKNGAPGGWPTINLLAVAINSPQSQKLAVGSTVLMNTKDAVAQTNHPKKLFNFWYDIYSKLSINECEFKNILRQQNFI